MTDSQIEQLEQHEVLLCVEGEWYALNAKSPNAPAKRPEFVPTAFYAYEIDSLDLLRGFLATISNRFFNQRKFSATKGRTTMDGQQTAR